MPAKNTSPPLQPNSYYHIYNIANESLMFKHDADYKYFLHQYKYYLANDVDLFAYVLMPSHFHFLIRTKDSCYNNDNFYYTGELFRRFFMSYAMYFNLRYQRIGNLFYRPYKRIRILTMDYLKYMVFYIHNNPVKDNANARFSDYKYSSFREYLTGSKYVINTKDTLEWFNNDMLEFMEFHDYIRSNIS